PSVFYPAVPKKLEEAILRSLAKKPEERYQSAREMADALEDALAALKAPGPSGHLDRTQPMARPDFSRAPAAAAEPARPRLGVAIGAIAAAGAGVVAVLAGAALVALGQREAA